MTDYVSRAALKLASVADLLELDFNDKLVLDIGSSTGGFTQYALEAGAQQVVGVEVGTNQIHPSLRQDPRVLLFEKTDFRELPAQVLPAAPDIILADVSFVSLRQILPHAAELASPDTQIVAMVKPQFEAQSSELNKGIVKNERLRREILKNFEDWAKSRFVIRQKADSGLSGRHGNHERFYLLQKAEK